MYDLHSKATLTLAACRSRSYVCGARKINKNKIIARTFSCAKVGEQKQSVQVTGAFQYY